MVVADDVQLHVSEMRYRMCRNRSEYETSETPRVHCPVNRFSFFLLFYFFFFFLIVTKVLDSFFGNVCELDLVFNFHKVKGYTYIACKEIIFLTDSPKTCLRRV